MATFRLDSYSVLEEKHTPDFQAQKVEENKKAGAVVRWQMPLCLLCSQSTNVWIYILYSRSTESGTNYFENCVTKQEYVRLPRWGRLEP